MSNERKRVLIIATVVKTHIMQFHIPTLKLFKDMGWETAVAARNDYSNPQDCQIPYCDQFYDIPFERIPFMPKNVECYRRLKDIIDHGNYQIIHCHTPVGGVLGRLAARKTRKEGTRVLYTAHGFHFYRGAPLKNWLMYYPIEKICSYFADDIITINQEDYRFARTSFASAKIHYLPGVGIDTSEFSPCVLTKEERSSTQAALGIQPGQRMILSVGELISRKNYKTAIDVIAKLNTDQLRYYICGQGVLRSEIEEYAKSRGVLDSVVFLGYIPEEYLPTFSSHPIELNIHRISGMSEHFVYFNDDMFLNGPVNPKFFFRKGKPCDFLRCAPIEFSDTTDVYAHVSTNSIRKVNFYYSYAKLFLRHPSKLVNVRYGLAASLDNFAKLGNIHHYVGLKDHHLPNAYCKKTFLDVWEAMPELMDRVSRNRFRTLFDVSQSVCRYWQLASGQFYPVSQSSRGRYLSISYPIDYVEATLNDSNIKMVCINDTSRDVDFEQTMTQIVALFEKKLPNKSSFEK